MENNDYKADIERLRDWTFNNVESHFREYILDDIIDAGEVDYIIGDYDWYFHWLDLAKEVKTLMDNIIYDYQQGKEELREYLNECVEIKQEIDKNLRTNPHFNEYEVLEWIGLEVEKDLKSSFISIIGNEEYKEKVVKELHRLLTQKGLINQNIKFFYTHFIPANNGLKRIMWLGTEIQITALVNLLIEKGFISREHQYQKHKFIVEHFINKKGKEFRERQLGVSLSKVNNNEVQHLFQEIIEIVEELTKINKN